MSHLKQITQIITSKKLLKNMAYYVIIYNYPIVGISYNIFKTFF